MSSTLKNPLVDTEIVMSIHLYYFLTWRSKILYGCSNHSNRILLLLYVLYWLSQFFPPP